MVDNAWYAGSSASEIADLVNAAELTAVEVAHAALRRLGEIDPPLRAFRRVWPERALLAAADVDRRIAAGQQLPLAGVPMAVKAVEAMDSAQVARLCAGGCVPVGATATPGPGTPWQTWGHTDRGHTENPWAPGRSPGGSSAGSAVAVAARIVHLATGIDGAGSIRIPAAWCGVYGLKITNGLLETRDRAGLAAPGPLFHRGRDAQRYLAALLGPVTDAGTDPGGLTVVWSPDLGFADVDPEATVIARAALDRILNAGLAQERDHVVRLFDPAPAWTRARAAGGAVPGRVREANDVRLGRLFRTVDLLATPTTPGPPHPHTGPGDRINTSLTWAFNLSSHPAVSVPAGLDSRGLPVGLQLVGRHHDERHLLELASRYQSSEPVSYPPASGSLKSGRSSGGPSPIRTGA